MKKFSHLLLTGLLSTALYAQSDLTLYNFNAIPQSLHVNPAMPQQTTLWIGLPALSGVHVHYHNSGFAPIDLFERGTNFTENKNRLIRSLDGNSHLSVNSSIDLLGVGFKAGRGFVSFGAYQNIDYRMDYPADILRFFNEGNTAGNTSNDELNTTFTLNSFNLENTVRTNAYIGYQHKFLDDRLSVGGRFKYIIGQQNTYIERINAEITSTDTTFYAKTDILVRTSGQASFIDGNTNIDPIAIGLPENSGFGIDFGAHYKINDHFDVNFSVVDLGQINWTANTRDYISKGEYTFDGIEVDYSDENPGQESQYEFDSLVAAFDFREVDGNSYTKRLMTRYFVGANYHLNDKHALGFLYHGRQWGEELYNDYSFSYQGRWSRTFQFIATYNIVNGTYNNIGAGFDLKLGAIQLYMISDNLLHAVMYENLQTTNLRLGINITFYGKKKNVLLDEEEQESGVRLVPTTEDSNN